MPVVRSQFVQPDAAHTSLYAEVRKISDLLLAHLNEPEAQAAIAVANVPKASSGTVQATFLPYATELGFKDEAKGLFLNYENKFLRPDYYLPLDKSGILLEVERGKTTINNMDLLDLWKCHICPSADYLFLLVPQLLLQSDKRPPTKPYPAVVKRMGSFFMPGNYTNVKSVDVFGY
jgi:hypothetical protein